MNPEFNPQKHRDEFAKRLRSIGNHKQRKDTLENEKGFTKYKIAKEAHRVEAEASRKDTEIHKEERKEERLARAESMKKVVDIYATEDLKYKTIGYGDLLHYLERGILGPSLLHASSVSRAPLQSDVSRIRQIREEIDTERNIEDTTASGYSSNLRFETKTNVFYPEGLFKVLQDELQGTQSVETYLKKPNLVNKDSLMVPESKEWLLIYAKQVFAEIISSNSALADIAKVLGQKEKIVLHNAPHGFEMDGQLEVGEYSSEQMRICLTNPELRERIRKEWLKYFWTNKSPTNNQSPRNLLHDESYNFKFGLIFTPEVKVAVSCNDDYPTEAVVTQPRIRPSQIAGILINPDDKIKKTNYGRGEPRWQNNASDLFDYTEVVPKHVRDEVYEIDQLDFLHQAKIKVPQESFKFLLYHHYENAFVTFLKNNDYWNANIENFLRKMEADKGALYDFYDAKRINPQLYDLLEKYAKEYLDNKLPVGKTGWEMLTEIAEKYKLPILDTNGNLLWPEERNHAFVEKLVTSRDQ